MNGMIFQTLKKRACFAHFPTLSTCRNEDKKIRQFVSLMLIFLITEKYIAFPKLLHIDQWDETI